MPGKPVKVPEHLLRRCDKIRAQRPLAPLALALVVMDKLSLKQVHDHWDELQAVEKIIDEDAAPSDTLDISALMENELATNMNNHRQRRAEVKGAALRHFR